MDQIRLLDCSRHRDVLKCAEVVKNGGVIVFPTDTVYGIGCDPYNHAAVNRVFAIKDRKTAKPLPILASTMKDVRNIALIDLRADTLARKYWPGKLTLVCPLLDRRISSLVVSNNDTIAVRIPGNTCTLELIRKCRLLVGTSANISGKRPARDIPQVLSSSLKGFDAVLDGGFITEEKESTIVDLSKRGQIDIIREGSIKSVDIRKTLSAGGRKD
ncbi:MAG TPA: L-threonylcarbamoyladenylate synthase [Nitrososphaeraceae archaeon]